MNLTNPLALGYARAVENWNTDREGISLSVINEFAQLLGKSVEDTIELLRSWNKNDNYRVARNCLNSVVVSLENLVRCPPDEPLSKDCLYARHGGEHNFITLLVERYFRRYKITAIEETEEFSQFLHNLQGRLRNRISSRCRYDSYNHLRLGKKYDVWGVWVNGKRYWVDDKRYKKLVDIERMRGLFDRI